VSGDRGNGSIFGLVATGSSWSNAAIVQPTAADFERFMRAPRRDPTPLVVSPEQYEELRRLCTKVDREPPGMIEIRIRGER
jgi:hypothetical protein